MVRSGVGTIIVVDSDKVELTNINRQILATNKTVNKYKVDIAEERKNDINNNTTIIKIKEFITKDNIDLLFTSKIDFVIDAIDTVKTKEEIIKTCLNKKIKFISVMGTGGKLDASKLEITDLSKTSYDKLAKKIRSDFKKEKIHGKIKVVSSTESPKTSKPIGSNAFVPAAAGILAANYAINTLIKE